MVGPIGGRPGGGVRMIRGLPDRCKARPGLLAIWVISLLDG